MSTQQIEKLYKGKLYQINQKLIFELSQGCKPARFNKQLDVLSKIK